MNLPDDEAIDRAAKALYIWDRDSGSDLIPWRYERETSHRENERDYYRQGVQAVLDALNLPVVAS